MCGHGRSKRVGALALLLLGLCIASPSPGQEATGDAGKSAKERLSDKASDEQRVDNCRVPPERRGTKSRPDCPAPQAAETSSKEQDPKPKQ